MKKIGLLAFISFLNLGLAFFSQFYIISILGAGKHTDALFAGMALPQLLLAVLSGSLINVLVPLFVGSDKEGLKGEIWGFIIFIGCIFSVLCLVLWLTAPIWLSILVPGFSSVDLDLLIQLSRIQLFGTIFTAISGVLWAYNYSINRFQITEFSQFIAGIVSIVGIYYLVPKYGTIAAAWIFTGKLFLQVAFLIPTIGFIWPNFKSQIYKESWCRIKPLLGGSIIYKTDPIVDRFLASMAPPGALSILYLCQQVYNAAVQIISKAFVAPTLPLFTEHARKNDWAEYKKLFWNKFYILLFFNFCSFIVGLTLFKLCIYKFSMFRSHHELFFQILILSSLSFIIPSIGQLMANSFYAMGETKKITKLGITAFVLGIPTKLMLYYYFDIKGLAFAISLYYLLSFLIIITAINKKFKSNVHTVVKDKII